MGIQRPPDNARGWITLAVWGDPIVSRALALLLEGSGFEARLVPAFSSPHSNALEGVHLLVLTPTPGLSIEHRESLLMSLKDTLKDPKVPVLELATPPKETREGGTRDESWYIVSWPCSLGELEQEVEAALFANHANGEQFG